MRTHMKSSLTYLFCLVISACAAHANAISIGETPSDFTLKSNKGAPVQLSTLKGKVVYIDFWASWCVSCAKSIPWLSTLQKKLGDDKFQIVAVNLDEHSEDADLFLKKNQAELLVGYDPAGKTPEVFQMKAMPTSYLLDRDGKVMYIHEGFKQKDADDLEKIIQKAI